MRLKKKGAVISMKHLTRELWLSVIGVGVTTLIYSLIMSSFSLWMGSAAFIMASFYFGMGCPTEKFGKITLSFVMGIVWALLSFAMLQNPLISGVWASSIMFALMTSAAIFLQGTIMPFTIVPGWLIAWGTTMLIISNVTVTHWVPFVGELFLCMMLGPILIAGAANVFSAQWVKWFPSQARASKAVDREEID